MMGCGRPLPRDYLPRRADVRWLAAIAFVLLAALVAATIERPQSAYRDAGRLMLMLAIGAAAGTGLLLGLAVVVRAAAHLRRDAPRAILDTATSFGVLGVGVVTLVIAVLAIESWPRGTASAQNQAATSAFFEWQRETVPLTVSSMDALRALAPRVDSAKRVKPAQMRWVGGAARALERVVRTLGVQIAANHRHPQLRALSLQLAHAVEPALQAARTMIPGRSPPSAARAELVRAQQGLQAFALQANALGSRLTAGQP